MTSGLHLRADRLDFAEEIAPMLVTKCVSCHGEERQKGGYRLDSPGFLMTAGDSGERPVIAGNADASLLYELIVSDDKDDRMPQDGEPFSMEEMASIARWLEEGASFGGVALNTSLTEVVVTEYPDPPARYSSPIPVTAISWVRGAEHIAFGGYHEVIVTDVGNREPLRITRLPQRIHELIPDADRDRLYYVGGQPGRGGEAGFVEIEGDGERTVLSLSRDVLLAADLSKDGELFAVGGADKSIRIIETGTKAERMRLTQHSDWVTSLTLLPEKGRLVSGSRDRTARVFDLRSGALLTTFRRHDAAVFGVAVMPDGETVVSGGADGSIRVWNMNSGDERKRIGGFDAGVVKLDLNDGRLVVVAADGVVAVISVDGWKRERRFAATTNGAASLGIDPETGRIVVGDLEGAARFLSLKSEAEPSVVDLLP